MDRDTRGMKERGKSLEEEFFARQNAKLKEKLRASLEREEAGKALLAAYPKLSPALVERFLEHGMDVEAVAALGLVPLVLVAWADGSVGEKERAAILRAADERGLVEGTRSHALLTEWIRTAPSQAVVDHWKHYVGEIVGDLTPAERDEVKSGIVNLARDIASAAGGFLGLGAKVSPEEQAALDRIAEAFGG